MIFKIKQKHTFCDFVGKEKIRAKKEKKGHFRSVWYISAIDAAQLPREHLGFSFLNPAFGVKLYKSPQFLNRTELFINWPEHYRWTEVLIILSKCILSKWYIP